MKLLFVINSMQGGGAARVTALLCNELIDRGEEVYMATNLSTHQLGYHLDDRVKVYSIYSKSHLTDNKIKRLYYHVRVLRKLLKEIRPDVIIGEQEDGTLYSIIARVFLGIPLVAHRHNTFKIRGFSRLQRLIYNSADMAVLLHRTDCDFVGDKIRKKCYIYNPCSFKTNIITQDTKENNVIVVGSIDRWYNKGFDQMLRIWKDVSKIYSDWNLVIVGSGSEQNTRYLENLVKEYNISETVVFTGYVNNVDEYLSRSSIFALPSRVEGFPMVLNEAISQSCACVAFELFGVIPEIYTSQAVSCVKDGDIKEFAEELKNMIASDVVRINLCKKALAELENYTIESIIPKWLSLFNNLVNENK